MSNLIELESSYCIENFEEILKKIKEKNYKFNYEVQEQDTYYTDKKLKFIKQKHALEQEKQTMKNLN